MSKLNLSTDARGFFAVTSFITLFPLNIILCMYIGEFLMEIGTRNGTIGFIAMIIGIPLVCVLCGYFISLTIKLVNFIIKN